MSKFRLKPDIRILGIDDGRFSRGKSEIAPLAGVVFRTNRTIEKMATAIITVDGDDIIPAITEIIGKTKVRPSLIMTDGVTFAGFNLMDPSELFSATGVSVMTIHKGSPDIGAMLSAVRSLHNDSKKKESILLSLSPIKVIITGREYTINLAGIDLAEAKSVLRKTTINGLLPEPVRLAHMLASTLQR